MSPNTFATRLLTTVLAAGLGVSIGRLLGRLLKRGLPPDDDPVSDSGKLIAAWRALETLEAQPLFVDPLAAALAGGAAVHEALHLARPFPGSPASSDVGAEGSLAADGSPVAAAVENVAAGTPTPVDTTLQPLAEVPLAQPTPARRFCISNVGSRVWWFDRQLAAALARPAGQPAKQPRQVVVLGAGYDTRPWRLALPPDVCWFEVDLPQVAAAKRQQLQQLGAGFDAAAPCAHLLRVAAWTSLPADLSRPGWSAALLGAGLDPGKPTVWIAEGLLMYLTPDQVNALLREMAGVSPRGSCLIVHNSTSELLSLIDKGAAAYAPFPPELVATWRSGWPLAGDRPALAELLKGSGWPQLLEATSRARIAADIVASQSSSGRDSSSRGSGDITAGTVSQGGGTAAASAVQPSADEVAKWVDFEAQPDEGRDCWAVFAVAAK